MGSAGVAGAGAAGRAGGRLRGKKRHEKVVAEARAAFDAADAHWAHADREAREIYQRGLVYRDGAEKSRLRKLAEAEAAYRSECEAREAQAARATPSSTS
ncbi:hypothetical protein ACFQ9X_20140 [Catenulispora yoronensis]